MIWSGVACHARLASAPWIVACEAPLRPSVDQYEPVATITISAPYSATSFAESVMFGMNSTFLSLSSWILR